MSKNPDPGAKGAQRVTQTFAGLAALTVAAGGAATFWLNGQIGAAQASAAGLEAQAGSSQQIAKRLGDTQAAYKETYDRISFLEAAVSEKSYVPTLLQQLQTLAAATHLTVSSVHPSALVTPAAPAAAKNADGTAGTKKAAPPPYDTMTVDLNMVGGYADTQTFLYDLTRFKKILSVTSIQMSPGGGDATKGAAPQVTTTLKLTAFVFHDDGAAPPAPDGETAQGAASSPPSVVPPPAAPTAAGAAGRATQGAVAATRAADGRSADAVKTF